MKTAELEIYDYLVGICPYCDENIEEQWGRVNDLTITGPDDSDGEEMDCPSCKKTFKVKIVSSIG